MSNRTVGSRPLYVQLAPLIAFVFTCAALPQTLPASSVSTVLSEAEAFVAGRIEEIRGIDGDQRGRRSRQTLRELEDRLVQGGIEASLARALSAHGEAADEVEGGGKRGGLSALVVARQRLRRYEEAMLRDPPDAHPDVRERLDRILEAPAFQVEPPRVTPIQRFASRIRERLGQALRMVVHVVGRNPALAFAVLVALVLSSLGAFVWLIFSRYRRHRGARPSAAGSSWEVSGRLEATPEAGAWIARGHAELSAGNLRQALKTVEAAAWLALRQAGLLPPTPGLTNLEGRRLLAADGDPELPAAFGRLLEIHERGVFAGRSVSEDEVRTAIGLAEHVVGQSARASAS